MLHSDLQHLCVNLFHLMDALDLEGVPDLEVSRRLKRPENSSVSAIFHSKSMRKQPKTADLGSKDVQIEAPACP